MPYDALLWQEEPPIVDQHGRPFPWYGHGTTGMHSGYGTTGQWPSMVQVIERRVEVPVYIDRPVMPPKPVQYAQGMARGYHTGAKTGRHPGYRKVRVR